MTLCVIYTYLCLSPSASLRLDLSLISIPIPLVVPYLIVPTMAVSDYPTNMLNNVGYHLLREIQNG